MERTVRAALVLLLVLPAFGCATKESLEWQDMGPTPMAHKKYAPQGLTWANGRLVLANTWHDVKSRIYEIDPDSMRVLRWFDMPPEAGHTSGLAWDNAHLWAVDYKSNKAYKIDLEASLESCHAAIVGEFQTTLRGTSACCFMPWQGETRLAISDFCNTGSTIVVDHVKALASGSARGAIVFRYKNQYFSQGLTYAMGYLWESESRLSGSVVNMICPDKLRCSRNAAKATIAQFAGPACLIEDLAWDGQKLWTSDESKFRIYKADVAAALSGRPPGASDGQAKKANR